MCVFCGLANSGGLFYSLHNRLSFNSLLNIVFIVNLDGPGKEKKTSLNYRGKKRKEKEEVTDSTSFVKP